jgi:hypothetical protein
MKTYNQNNFHKHTFCLWKEVSPADFEVQKPQFKSKSGSEYYFTTEGVYRTSNHWGRAANCRWRLVSQGNYKSQHTIVGFAKWTDFYPNDETAKLFFIQYLAVLKFLNLHCLWFFLILNFFVRCCKP